MQIIKCTGKLQKEMGLKKGALVEPSNGDSYLGPWHANLIYIDGKKCILFTNDKTLINFIVVDVKREKIKNLSNMFKEEFARFLENEGLEKEMIQNILSEYDAISYSKTDSKVVLGSMNDLSFHYKYLIKSEGGVGTKNIPYIIQHLNRMPMGPIKMDYAIDAFKEIYKDAI